MLSRRNFFFLGHMDFVFNIRFSRSFLLSNTINSLASLNKSIILFILNNTSSLNSSFQKHLEVNTRQRSERFAITYSQTIKVRTVPKSESNSFRYKNRSSLNRERLVFITNAYKFISSEVFLVV